MNEYYAHRYHDREELLIDHLHKTAELAERFASEFGSGRVGKQLGLLHDVGKHTKAFQEVLCGRRYGVNHAIVGAELYYTKFNRQLIPYKKLALIICMCINSHHSKLHKLERYDPPTDYQSLMQILTDDKEKLNALASQEEWEAISSFIVKENLLSQITIEDCLDIRRMSPVCRMFYTRMLFSCLVDADYTAAAIFEDDQYGKNFEGMPLEPEKRLRMLQKYREGAFSGKEMSPMNLLREEVYRSSEEAGKEGSPGLYTMTAPTGSGKTLALIVFALRQALHHRMKRIFIVLPYLSIITQNAKIYKDVFGDDVVLEDDSDTVYTEESKLLSDRWTAPIIVTTSVRFFETLFREKPTDVRRLHQVSNAVIVFDESQTLPLGVTDITMEIMKELTENYRSTVLLSTATQPTYRFRKKLNELQVHATEVMRDPEALFRKFDNAKKTKTIFSTDRIWTYEDLAKHFEGKKQVLLIFNTVSKSQNTYSTLKDILKEDLFYLSSSLCPAHRMDMLNRLKDRLEAGKRAWLISTQCIEAGVDIDFPYGAREYAPYTSIVQSAGRINRNGKTQGELLVFMMGDQGRSGYPGASYKNESMISYSMSIRSEISLNDLKNVEEYYRLLFTGSSGGEEDKREIMEAVDAEDYEALSEAYHLIDDKEQDIVIVPYKKDLYEEIKLRLKENNWSLTKTMMREVHEITVSVKLKEEMKHFCRQLQLATHQGVVSTNWFLLKDSHRYSEDLGFVQTTDIGNALSSKMRLE